MNKGKYTVRKGEYVYRKKTRDGGPVLFEGGWLRASLYFKLMPVKRDKYLLLKGDRIVKVKTIHGITKVIK